MNVNPHLQHLQQQQSTPGQVQVQQQQPGQQQPMSGGGIALPGQSPPISQLQLQHQQLQRQQQLLNQHLQQSQTQQQQLGTPTGQHVNPLLASLNGNPGTGNSSQTNGSGLLMNNTVNPVLQMQLQQQQQQQAQQQQFQQLQAQQLQHLQQQAQAQAQAQAAMQQSQVPIIKQVWSHNLEHEFQTLRNFINDKTADIYISIHQEIPGIVARPIGTFKSSSDYHFQTLRSNADLLNIIQLSLCIIKLSKNGNSNIRNELNGQRSIIWQFNFFYDLTKEMYNEEHLAMLSQTSQINFQLHMTQGIPHLSFAELMIESGLLLDHQHINWISYHAGYDLGFFISLMMNTTLPIDEKEFSWWCSKYFPNFYDLKYIGNQILSNKANNDVVDQSKTNKPSIEYLAEELHLLPISPTIRQHFNSNSITSSQQQQQQQQMTSTLHAYLSMECFKELIRQSGFDISMLTRYKGFIWGLGTLSETAEERQNGGVTTGVVASAPTPTPGTPGSKGLYGRS